MTTPAPYSQPTTVGDLKKFVDEIGNEDMRLFIDTGNTTAQYLELRLGQVGASPSLIIRPLTETA